MCVALQSGYEELWAIRDDQLQPSAEECPTETASPPSYHNHTAPPPPYTAHARLGEVSIHRSYHYDPSQDSDVIADDNLLVENESTTVVGWLDEGQDNTHGSYSSTEQQVTTENGEQISHFPSTQFHEDHPLVTSTPTSSLSELRVSPNINMFVKSLAPLSQNNNLPPIKPIPLLRPIRSSAPNLFTSHDPPLSHDPLLNNTLPRTGRLPPLRRKLNCSGVMDNSPCHSRSLSDGGLQLSFYDNHRTLSRTVSAGECEPISEVSLEQSSNETINNS